MVYAHKQAILTSVTYIQMSNGCPWKQPHTNLYTTWGKTINKIIAILKG